jgi:hypothetical protein
MGLSSMVLPDILLSASLLSLGGVVVGAGLLRLDRMDRRRLEITRQSNCRWHQWQTSEERGWLVCRLCGKRARRLNPWEDHNRDRIPSDNILP